MNETQLRALIRAVIEEILSAKRAVALFTGALLGFDDAVGQLAALRSTGWRFSCLRTPTAEAILDPARVAAIGAAPAGAPGGGALTEEHGLLVVPTLTTNVAAKVAHGIADDLATNVIASFIRAGRPIVAAVDGACPDHPMRRALSPRTPVGYQRALRANLAALASFGITLTYAADLADAVRAAAAPPDPASRPAPAAAPPASRPAPSAARPAPPAAPRALIAPPAPRRPAGPARRVLGQGAVQAWPGGTALEVPAGALITPAARDLARKRGISITTREEAH
ncbi:MAG: hypothetical protein FWD74_04345 [Actinomycetia bacterium]|nr:hypothetical protein [Actinomycetes bacterium]